jgi:hypothetical protein
MTISLARSTGNPTIDNTTMETDDDDKTVRSGGRNSKNDEEIKDFLIKITFRPHRRDIPITKKEVLDIHRSLCQAMTEVPGKLTIIDNSKEEHVLKSSLTGKEQQFKPKQRSKDNQWIIVMRLITDLPLSAIKHYYEVHEILQGPKCNVLMHKHLFTEEDWNIAKIGFLHNIHVGHVPIELAKKRVMDTIADQNPTIKLPKMELFSTFITSTTDKGTNKTQGYEIQCLSKDAKTLGRILEKALLMTPYYYKRKEPATFAKSVRIQNHCLTNTWVIKISGVSKEMMVKLKPALKKNQSSIADIIETRRIEDDGDWKLLVPKDHFSRVYKGLQDTWEEMINLMGVDIISQNNATMGMEARISSSPDGPADDESGDDSVGTALTGYLSSFSLPTEATDDQFDQPPTRYGGNRSYAAVAQENSGGYHNTGPGRQRQGRGGRGGRGGRNGRAHSGSTNRQTAEDELDDIPHEVQAPSTDPVMIEIMIMLKELQEENRVLKETLLAQTKHVPPPAPAPESPSTITPLTAADQHDRFTSLEKLVRDLSQTVLSLAQGGLTIAPVEPASIQTSEQPLGKRPCHSTTPVSRRLQYTEMDTFEDDLEVQPSEISISHRKAGGQSSPPIKKC